MVIIDSFLDYCRFYYLLGRGIEGCDLSFKCKCSHVCHGCYSFLTITIDGSKQLKYHVILPGELLVHKFTELRAPELDSLYSTIASLLNNDFRSQRNKRR
uniref:Uncharacterized protein n=1 Tax=Helianthus annuus TaxID=4232 RepID=A0A251RLS3_HELAN